MITYVLLVLGLVILVAGAELLVRGSVQLASLARISPLVIGLTVVAFGTSAPELAVSAVSSYRGEAEIALGNVVGSNIFNVALILGLSATIVPLTVASQLVRFDVPLMIGITIGVWLAALDGTLQFWEGIVMWALFFIYTGWLVISGRSEPVDTACSLEPVNSAEAREVGRPVWMRLTINLSLVVIGLAMLVVGARMLVESATTIARQYGVSDIIIGLTIVAAGTSLPELATSIVAAFKGERDIAIGNVVGSNVFNLLVVLSTASVLSGSGIAVSPEVFWFDLTIMVWIALLCWPMFVSHGVLSRSEGIIMLAVYLVYTSLLISDASGFQQSERYKSIFCFVVMPATLAIISLISWKIHRSQTPSVNHGPLRSVNHGPLR